MHLCSECYPAGTEIPIVESDQFAVMELHATHLHMVALHLPFLLYLVTRQPCWVIMMVYLWETAQWVNAHGGYRLLGSSSINNPLHSLALGFAGILWGGAYAKAWQAPVLYPGPSAAYNVKVLIQMFCFALVCAIVVHAPSSDQLAHHPLQVSDQGTISAREKRYELATTSPDMLIRYSVATSALTLVFGVCNSYSSADLSIWRERPKQVRR